MKDTRVTMIRASAGSGKTHRLTSEVCAAVAGDARVEGLVAVTFTTRAASELEARIRQSLVRASAFDKVQRLPLAYVGTVHAVALRLVQELAFVAGLSPRVEVLPEDGGQLLRESLEWALAPDFVRRMEALARRLGIEVDHMTGRVNWLWPVTELMELARQNRIGPLDLPAMAERSAAELGALLPPAMSDGAAVDTDLERQIAAAEPWMRGYDDGTSGTREACRAALDVFRLARGGARLPWTAWVKLATLSPTNASRDRFVPLQTAAARYERHPAFRSDLLDFTRGVFEAARLGLSAFARWKRERGLVDYTDMIDQAVGALREPEVRAELGRRLELVVVDEFQDTSPLQLAFFAALHGLAGRSIWVGDRKQTIFEFAGADPVLIDAAAEWTKAEGGEVTTLPQNRRSRPELVEACSIVFSSALKRFGYDDDEVTVSPHRPSAPGLAPLPPVGLWWLAAKNVDEEAECIAEGVRRLLEDPPATPVIDRATGIARDLRAGDVAVLVDTNARADLVAGALQARGIAATHARAGLLATPEGTLIDAALRWLLDARDTLSLAILEALQGFGGLTQEQWLEARLRRIAAGEPEPVPSWQERLVPLRERLPELSPAEALDLVAEALDAVRLATAWPEPAQRRGNLDALRALAHAYEDRAAQRREAATVAGLLRFFDDARTPVLTREGQNARDAQHLVSGEHAVTVSTYHKAKGLEWPVVVMGSLDKKERRTAFGVHPESDAPAFDAADPLAGRRVRYWPRPFAPSVVPLVDAVGASPEGRAVAIREDHERVRLLYVGMTRARDHLVLAARTGRKGPKAAWLDELADDRGPLLDLAAAARPGATSLSIRKADGEPHVVAARTWTISVAASSPQRLATREQHRWFARPAPLAVVARYGIAPSRAAEDWPTLPTTRVVEVDRLPGSLHVDPDRDLDWAELGHATHDFLAADDPLLPSHERRACAEALLAARGMSGRIRPEELMAAGDRLRAWVEGRWPRATWHRELPIEARIDTGEGARLLSGRIDLLLEIPAGLVLLDHKTFPAPSESAWRKAAREHGAQLMAYVEALSRVGPRPVVATWLHFVIGGGMVRIAAQTPTPEHPFVTPKGD